MDTISRMLDTRGRLQGIYTAPTRGAPMQSLTHAEVVAGEGIVGDRYQRGCGTFSARFEIVQGARALSLIDSISLDECNQRLGTSLAPAQLRRNLWLDGLDLMALRGCTLAIGEARIELVGACPPCGYLSRLLGEDMRRGLHGIGGMRARVLAGGVIEPGMAVALATP